MLSRFSGRVIALLACDVAHVAVEMCEATFLSIGRNAVTEITA
jgi:hypothetical protein